MFNKIEARSPCIYMKICMNWTVCIYPFMHAFVAMYDEYDPITKINNAIRKIKVRLIRL